MRELGLESDVVFTGQIREQDKAPLYSAATVFVFPSLYEGFGMPVLEAMACGAAVVTSNSSALPEVAGDAAVLVDPDSDGRHRRGLLALLQRPGAASGAGRGGAGPRAALLLGRGRPADAAGLPQRGARRESPHALEGLCGRRLPAQARGVGPRQTTWN